METLYFITESYPFETQELSFLHAEVAALSRRYDVTLLPFRAQSGPYVEPLPEGVRVELVRNRLPLEAYLPLVLFQRDFWRELAEARRGSSFGAFARRVGVIWRHGARALRYQEALRAYLRRKNARGVLYFFWSTPETYAFARMRMEFPALRFIVRAHGYDLYREVTRFDWLPYRRRVDERLDRHLFVCAQGRAYYLRLYGVADAARYSVAYLGCNGYEPAPPPAPDAPFTLVSCARAIPVKRLELIVRALALWPEARAVSWTYFGDGPLLPELRRLADEAANPRVSINLRGRVPNAALGAEYAALRPHALVNVSASEGLPVSMMEALSAGIPLVGTDVGGSRELIVGETGVLLPAELTPEALCAALVAFSREPRARQLARRAAARALWEERYRASDCAEKTCKLIGGRLNGADS